MKKEGSNLTGRSLPVCGTLRRITANPDLVLAAPRELVLPVAYLEDDSGGSGSTCCKKHYNVTLAPPINIYDGGRRKC